MNIHQEKEIHEFNHIYKELDDLYHEIALKIGISNSALAILYTVCVLGDGCLQKDVCQEAYISKQTVNSSVRKLEKNGYLYLEQGTGRDKHIRLTEMGRRFVKEKIRPVIRMENEAFLDMEPEERKKFISLSRKYVDRFRIREKKLLEVLT